MICPKSQHWWTVRQDSKTGKLVPELFLSASVVNVPVFLGFCHFINLKCSTIQQDSILQECQALPGEKEGHPHHKKTQGGFNDYKILHKKRVLYISGCPSESLHILRKPQMPGTNPRLSESEPPGGEYRVCTSLSAPEVTAPQPAVRANHFISDYLIFHQSTLRHSDLQWSAPR